MRRHILGCAIIVALISSSAVAGDKDEAKQLFESGLKLMKVDDFLAAAANFERSAALYPTQNTLFNLANCYKALRRYGEALEVLKRLSQDFGDKLKPEIKEEAGRQEAEIRSVAATLIVKVVPDSAQVAIDGKDAGAARSLRPLLLTPGDHLIEAKLPGYRSSRRTVRLVSQAERTEQLVLETEQGYLMVRSEPSGAVVVVDGEEKAKTPLAEPLRVAPGSHVVALHMPGRRQVERRVEILAGERQTLDVALLALDATAPEVTSDPGATAPGTTLVRATSESGAAPSPGRRWRILAWSSSAGALTAGIAAMVFWKVLGDGRFADAQSYKSQYEETNSTSARDSAIAAYNDAQRYGKIAIGCGAVGGALAVTAVLSFMVDAGHEQNARSNSVSLTPMGLMTRF